MDKETGALSEYEAAHIRNFVWAILHGDDTHKLWLIEAAESFIAGKEIPEVRFKKEQ